MAGQARLRRRLRRAADGAAHRSVDQKAARRGAALRRPAGRRHRPRRGRRRQPGPALREVAMRARAAIALVELTAAAAFAGGWNVEGYLGAPVNLSTPLSIEQSGQPTLRVTARYETRPFDVPRYYHVHVGYWSGKSEWAVELTHHKIFLTNPPDEVG